MSTQGMQLLSRVIRTGELAPVIEYGISSDDFSIRIEQVLFDTLVNYAAASGHAGAVIGPSMLKQRFPQIELSDDCGMSLEALCEEVRKRRLIVELKEAGDALLEAAEQGTDPLMAMGIAQTRLSKLQGLGLSRTTDVSFTTALHRIINRYEARKEGITFSRLSWPWSHLNTLTGGLQDDDYIVLYGRPKNMKSWVLAKLIAHAFLQGTPALVYTKEMLPDNLLMRVAAIILGIPYQEFRMSNLEPQDEAQLYELQAFVKDMAAGGFGDRLMCLSGQDVAEGGDTMHWLRAKIERYSPGVVFVDGLYLMSDGSKKPPADWTRVTSISRAARQLQLAMKIPLVCTVQANRKAAQHGRAELDEIAYADALGQDATIAFRIIAERHQPTIAMVTGGSREFKLDGIRIGGIPATDFDYKEELDENDITEAKKSDKSDTREEKAARERKEARKPRGGPPPDLSADMDKAMLGIVG